MIVLNSIPNESLSSEQRQEWRRLIDELQRSLEPRMDSYVESALQAIARFLARVRDQIGEDVYGRAMKKVEAGIDSSLGLGRGYSQFTGGPNGAALMVH